MIEMLPPPTPATPASTSPRELTPAEILSLEPIFAAAGASLPDPAISTFVGVVEDGVVQAFGVLQFKLHAEPLWVAEHRSDLFLPLIREMEQTILRKVGSQWVYTFAPAGKVSRLAELNGMSLEPFVVWSKLVAPPAPSKPITALDPIPITQEELEEFPGVDLPQEPQSTEVVQ